MAKLSIVAGATSQSVNVFVRDSTSTTGGGLVSIAPAGGALLTGTKLYYSFTGANASAGVSVALSVLAAVNSAWSSAGIVQLDNTNMIGWVRIDIPNAALAAAKGRALSFLMYGGTNMAPTPFEIELTGVDNQDGVHFGLTSLPNATASASGGIPTIGTGAGQIHVDGATGAVDSNLTKTLGTASAGAAGSVGIDWAQVANKTSTVGLTGTTISTTQTIASVSGSVGSVTGAVGSVTGAVGSVTGNVGGNIVGSVASVVGAVGSVTGAVGSVTGNVGGNVVGTVASVVGAVGSVTGNVGGNVTGTIGGYASGQDPATLVLDVAQSSHNLSGSIGKDIGLAASGGSGIVNGYAAGEDPATLVWNALAASFNTVNTMGHLLNSAGAAADPWVTLLPGSYTSGEAGNILGNLVANLASRFLVTSGPFSGSNTITLQRGFAYLAYLGNAITFSSTVWPDITGYPITLWDDVAQVVLASGTIISSGGSPQTVQFTFNSAATTALALGQYHYVVRAFSTPDYYNMASGLLIVQN